MPQSQNKRQLELKASEWVYVIAMFVFFVANISLKTDKPWCEQATKFNKEETFYLEEVE